MAANSAIPERVRAVLTIALMLPLAGCGRQPDAGAHRRLREEIAGKTLAARMKDRKVPGVSIAVIRDWEIAWARAIGTGNSATLRPLTEATVFQASSISKAVTAVIALRLVDRGLLDLNAAVNPRLISWKIPENEFTRESPVTLLQLLSHTSCLNRPAGGFAYDGPYPTTVEVLEGRIPAKNLPAAVECVPGSEVRYSNFGYVVIQKLIEDVTGRSFASLAREQVFEPAGMRTSTFEQPLPEPLLREAAFPHDAGGSPMKRSFNPNAVGQGGMWTTPADLARFLLEIMRARRGDAERVVSSELAAKMLTPHFPDLDDGQFMGLGVMVLGDWAILQAGADPGFRCLFAGFPKAGTGIAVMLNGEGGELLQLRVLLDFVVESFLMPVIGRVVLGAVCFLLLLSALVVWPAGYLIGKIRRAVPACSRTARERTFCRVARLTAFSAAAVVLASAYPYARYSLSDPGSLSFSAGSNAARILMLMLAVAVALSLVLAALVAQAWRRRVLTLPARVYFTAVSAAAVAGGVLWFDLLGLL